MASDNVKKALKKAELKVKKAAKNYEADPSENNYKNFITAQRDISAIRNFQREVNRA